MLNRHTHNTVLELNMARPPVNALNAELIHALHAQIDSAQADGFEAIVISGQPEIFSAGLDVPELMSFERPQMIEFWIEFMTLLRCIALSPIPIVAAITGHSPAGGAVIALPCDYRIMAQGSKKGPFKIGLNEVQVGLMVPPATYSNLVHLTGARIASQLAVEGVLIDSDAAFTYGLVDEIQETKDVVATALQWCERHLALPRHAMLKTRTMARQPLVDSYSTDDYFKVDDFVEHWFNNSTQTTLQMLVEKLSSR